MEEMEEDGKEEDIDVDMAEDAKELFNGFLNETPAEKRAQITHENDKKRKENKERKEEEHQAKMAALSNQNTPLASVARIADDIGEKKDIIAIAKNTYNSMNLSKLSQLNAAF
ncbi:hypothetical protein LZ554_004355 [Drepanopeziza brunnea f. sp. 'monogermtubi']|nr:hypothetical protein LZ554_004355 [Drepanopeziza brunnea f. sp. 'monogermtubi']